MAIIGISGKIGSGKNLTGQIIQYLISEYKNHGQILNSFNIDNDYSTSSGWQQKAFAYKLKQIVSILTGISIEDLEKQEVKDRVLGNEWHKKINVVGLEDMQALEFGIANGLGVPLQVMTVRQFLQRIGTEAMRNVIHENVWVNALFANYYPYPIKNSTNCVSKWIITDVRFPNELKAIEDRGGITIRVNRDVKITVPQKWYNLEEKLYNSLEEFCNDTKVITYEDYLNGLKLSNEVLINFPAKTSEIRNNFAKCRYKLSERLDNIEKELKQSEHSSETSLDNANFKYTIDNNGTIEELVEQVKEILIKEHII